MIYCIKNIINYILDSHRAGNPLTQAQIRSYVRDNYNISASNGWIYSFLQRYSKLLKIGKSFPQEDTMLTVPVEFLQQHLTNMTQYVQGCCSELLFNIDEMGSSEWEDRKVKKVVIPFETDPKSIYHKTTRKIRHQTLVSIVSAAGDALTPLIISSTNVEREMISKGYRSGEDAIFKIRNPAYIDEDIFYEYIKDVLIPYVKVIRKNKIYAKEFSVLLMDSCIPHLNQNTLKILGKNGIKAITFPAHTTNIFQPLDLTLFGI